MTLLTVQTVFLTQIGISKCESFTITHTFFLWKFTSSFCNYGLDCSIEGKSRYFDKKELDL